MGVENEGQSGHHYASPIVPYCCHQGKKERDFELTIFFLSFVSLFHAVLHDPDQLTHNTTIHHAVGWTALVWATNNKHDNMVRLLLEQGASTSAQTAKGHTIVDFLRHDPNDNSKIVQIFQEPCRRGSNSSCSSDASLTCIDAVYLPPGIDETEDASMKATEQQKRTMFEGANVAFSVSMASLRKVDQVRLCTG